MDARRILVVCRAVARDNWVHEFRKFSKLERNYRVLYGTVDVEDFVAETTQCPDTLENLVVVCSYESAGRLAGNFHFQFDSLIVDESHYLKNPGAARTKLILGTEGLVRKAKRTWLLTGTPTPNHAGELWTTLYTFGATKLPYDQFIDRFCNTRETGFGLQITGTKTDKASIEALQQIMRPIVLRRTEEDVAIELPKMVFDTKVVPPGPVELSEHEYFLPYVIPTDRTKDLEKELQEQMGIMNAIVHGKYASTELIDALKQESKSLGTLRRFTALQKLQPACDMIREELKNNAYQKCVIFGIHRGVLEGALLRLQEFDPVLVYGGTRPSKIESRIRQFQSPSNPCRIFIGNISAAGTSISLTAAHHIFFLEESWTPGDNAQAAMRCGGVNQKNTVFVRTFALDNSVDQKVSELLRRKSEEQSKIYEKYDSNQRLRELL